MIYVYAITEAAASVAGRGGIEEQPVHRLLVCDLAALYSIHDHAQLQPTPEMLWRHDAVVESAMEHGPALPVRFGTTLPDTDALAAALEGEAPRLRRQLDRVRGCVELAVRVGLPQPAGECSREGRDYMRLRLSEHQARQTAAEHTLVPLDELAVCSRRGADGTETLSASYLVHEHEVGHFADEVRGLQDRHRELSLSCTGPWPPYSFVGEEPA